MQDFGVARDLVRHVVFRHVRLPPLQFQWQTEGSFVWLTGVARNEFFDAVVHRLRQQGVELSDGPLLVGINGASTLSLRTANEMEVQTETANNWPLVLSFVVLPSTPWTLRTQIYSSGPEKDARSPVGAIRRAVSSSKWKLRQLSLLRKSNGHAGTVKRGYHVLSYSKTRAFDKPKGELMLHESRCSLSTPPAGTKMSEDANDTDERVLHLQSQAQDRVSLLVRGPENALVSLFRAACVVRAIKNGEVIRLMSLLGGSLRSQQDTQPPSGASFRSPRALRAHGGRYCGPTHIQKDWMSKIPTSVVPIIFEHLHANDVVGARGTSQLFFNQYLQGAGASFPNTPSHRLSVGRESVDVHTSVDTRLSDREQHPTTHSSETPAADRRDDRMNWNASKASGMVAASLEPCTFRFALCAVCLAIAAEALALPRWGVALISICLYKVVDESTAPPRARAQGGNGEVKAAAIGGNQSAVADSIEPMVPSAHGELDKKGDEACLASCSEASSHADTSSDNWIEPSTESRLVQGPVGADTCWNEPPSAGFHVRTATYLTDRQKAPSREATFRPIGVNAYLFGEDGKSEYTFHAAKHVPSLRQHITDRPDQFFFFVVFIMPGTPRRCSVFAYERRLRKGTDPTFDNVLDTFLAASDAEKNERLKYIPVVRKAPWAVLAGIRALGGERPTLLCNKLESRWFQGSNYVEVDVDISSSSIANAVAGIMLPAMAGLIIEHGFLLEGKTTDELPERMLGTTRVQATDMVSNTVRLKIPGTGHR